MSQFCGSLAALSNRSLLTVILYCAAAWEAANTVIDTPAMAAQTMATILPLRCCMTAPPLSRPCVAVGTADRNKNTTREAAKGQRRVEPESDPPFAKVAMATV